MQQSLTFLMNCAQLSMLFNDLIKQTNAELTKQTLQMIDNEIKYDSQQFMKMTQYILSLDCSSETPFARIQVDPTHTVFVNFGGFVNKNIQIFFAAYLNEYISKQLATIQPSLNPQSLMIQLNGWINLIQRLIGKNKSSQQPHSHIHTLVKIYFKLVMQVRNNSEQGISKLIATCKYYFLKAKTWVAMWFFQALMDARNDEENDQYKSQQKRIDNKERRLINIASMKNILPELIKSVSNLSSKVHHSNTGNDQKQKAQQQVFTPESQSQQHLNPNTGQDQNLQQQRQKQLLYGLGLLVHVLSSLSMKQLAYYILNCTSLYDVIANCWSWAGKKVLTYSKYSVHAINQIPQQIRVSQCTQKIINNVLIVCQKLLQCIIYCKSNQTAHYLYRLLIQIGGQVWKVCIQKQLVWEKIGDQLFMNIQAKKLLLLVIKTGAEIASQQDGRKVLYYQSDHTYMLNNLILPLYQSFKAGYKHAHEGKDISKVRQFLEMFNRQISGEQLDECQQSQFDEGQMVQECGGILEGMELMSQPLFCAYTQIIAQLVGCFRQSMGLLKTIIYTCLWQLTTYLNLHPDFQCHFPYPTTPRLASAPKPTPKQNITLAMLLSSLFYRQLCKYQDFLDVMAWVCGKVRSVLGLLDEQQELQGFGQVQQVQSCMVLRVVTMGAFGTWFDDVRDSNMNNTSQVVTYIVNRLINMTKQPNPPLAPITQSLTLLTTYFTSTLANHHPPISPRNPIPHQIKQQLPNILALLSQKPNKYLLTLQIKLIEKYCLVVGVQGVIGYVVGVVDGAGDFEAGLYGRVLVRLFRVLCGCVYQIGNAVIAERTQGVIVDKNYSKFIFQLLTSLNQKNNMQNIFQSFLKISQVNLQYAIQQIWNQNTKRNQFEQENLNYFKRNQNIHNFVDKFSQFNHNIVFALLADFYRFFHAVCWLTHIQTANIEGLKDEYCFCNTIEAFIKSRVFSQILISYQNKDKNKYIFNTLYPFINILFKDTRYKQKQDDYLIKNDQIQKIEHQIRIYILDSCLSTLKQPQTDPTPHTQHLLTLHTLLQSNPNLPKPTHIFTLLQSAKKQSMRRTKQLPNDTSYLTRGKLYIVVILLMRYRIGEVVDWVREAEFGDLDGDEGYLGAGGRAAGALLMDVYWGVANYMELYDLPMVISILIDILNQLIHISCKNSINQQQNDLMQMHKRFMHMYYKLLIDSVGRLFYSFNNKFGQNDQNLSKLQRQRQKTHQSSLQQLLSQPIKLHHQLQQVSKNPQNDRVRRKQNDKLFRQFLQLYKLLKKVKKNWTDDVERKFINPKVLKAINELYMNFENDRLLPQRKIRKIMQIKEDF